jgi:hypothetical protein
MVMMSPRLRDAVAVVVIAIVAGMLVFTPPLERLRGLSIDILTMLRWRLFGAIHKPEQSPHGRRRAR